MFSVPNEVVSAYYTLYFHTYTITTNYFTWNEELMKGDNKMKIAKPIPKRQLEILDQDYISIDEISELYGCSRNMASRYHKEILNELKEMGKKPMIRGRSELIPLDAMLKKYPMNYKRIQRAVEREMNEPKVIKLNLDDCDSSLTAN